MLSGCRHDILTTHRARLIEPFQAAVAEVIGEMEDGTWDQGPSMRAAFMRDQGGGSAAPTGWVGHGGSLDGSRTNQWYGMFPQECLDGVGEGVGDPEQAGSAWERRRKQFQRLGDCCLRLCADMWSMVCFLWTAADRPAPTKDRSKRGRAWARKAMELMAANPVQMAKDISIYRMSWLSKRHSVYARGARAAWTECQW